MMTFNTLYALAFIVVAAALANPAVAQQSAPIPEKFELFDFKDDLTANRLQTNGTTTQANGRLTLQANSNSSASVTLLPPTAKWDIDRWTYVSLDVRNPTQQLLHINVRVMNEGGSDWGRSAINSGFLAPRERKTFNVFLYRPDNARDPYPELQQFIGMKGLPGGLQAHWHVIDATDVRSLQIEILKAPHEQKLEVFAITANHPIVPQILRDKDATFFPFVDKFGQYRYDNWPGKVKNEAQLKRNASREADDLRAHPGPDTWDKYGGWKGGPQLRPSGHFATTKIGGKWWLVDPDGHLFWSHGPNSVGNDSAGTRITGREKFFKSLPPRTGATAALWSQNKADKNWDFDFLGWNAQRQYGSNWRDLNPDLTHRRLRSWGMNTIGNWSDNEIMKFDRTPYTVSLWPWSPTISGDTVWDVFNPEFAKNFAGGIAGGVKNSAADPWCIGYFVHNEMGWPGSSLGTVSLILASPESATKRELVNAMRDGTPNIADFNRKTKRNFADWDALLANRDNFDLSGVQTEAELFYSRYAEKYYRTCAEALHKYAPNQLYLGSRMHVSNPLSIRAAAKWCDVLSFNLYRDDISDFKPADVDKPVIASEFHFGALDRGALGTGLQPASDENDRAAKYRFYVEGALRNPYLVGAHWFAYCPQAITGRGDGENYEDGLFDITNNPYPELRSVLRGIGDSMYVMRSQVKPLGDAR